MKNLYDQKLCTSLIILLLIFLKPFYTNAQQTVCSNEIGNQGGFTYEYWKDNGNGCMTLNDGGKFYIEWNNINNLLARKGKRPGVKNQTVTYGANYNPNGNSYLCIYGWTTNPLIEYYIVESWGDWRPPGSGYNGSFSSDGGTYDIYETTRENQPSIEGTRTFKQFWSVRRNKRTNGTVTCANHFNAWSSNNMNLGNLYEVSLTVEGYQSSGSCNIYQMSMGTSNSDNGGVINIQDGAVYSLLTKNNKCVDVAGNSQNNGANIHQWSCHNGDNQKWQINKVDDIYYEIKSLRSGKCLDVAGWSNSNGGNIQQYNCSRQSNQQWRFTSLGDGVFTITSRFNNKCLDLAAGSNSNGANIQQYTCSQNNQNQHFFLEQVQNRNGIQLAKETLSDITLYPNPVVSVMTVNLEDTDFEKVSFHIYDIKGKRVLSMETANEKRFEVPVQNLDSGLYLLEINSSGNKETKTFMKI